MPESVTEIGAWAFWSASNLVHIEMPGVENVKELESTGYEGLTINRVATGRFYGCTSLETVVVPASFSVEASQFNKGNATARVYSMSTTPAAWNSDRADNCLLRTGTNNAFISTCEEGKLSPVYYYSENKPTDTDYTYWYRDTDGSIKVWSVTE